MDISLLQDTLKLLFFAVVIAVIFRRIRLPFILGYLFIGTLVGPNALGIIENNSTTLLLGEIGVALLLFSIGLEFSIGKFMAMRNVLFGLGATQVFIGTVSGMLIAMMIGIHWQAALIIGGALSLSSTAIVIKQLVEQLELHEPHGRLAVGILLFQDLAAVPFLVMIPLLAVSSDGQQLMTPLFFALCKGIAALAVMLIVGRWLLRPFFDEVAHGHSPELFTFTTLLVALAAAWMTHSLGLSFAFGAFVAGMMLSETQYRHQIEVDIRPFRDLLLALFFMIVGMQLDFSVLREQWYWVLLLVLGIMLGKGMVISLLTRIIGYDATVSLRTGITLGQGSEFGIALLTLALSTGLIGVAEIQPVLLSVVISMALSPLMLHHGHRFVRHLPFLGDDSVTALNSLTDSDDQLRDHVVICGFGHTGQHIAKFLKLEGIQYHALDTDVKAINRALHNNEKIFFGDAANPDILRAVNLQVAKAVVISFESTPVAIKVLQAIRSIHLDVPVIVRARDNPAAKELSAAGATEVIPQDIEASMMLTTHLLLALDVPVDDVLLQIKMAQRYRYPALQQEN